MPCILQGDRITTNLLIERYCIRVARYRQERPPLGVTLVNQLLLDFLQLSQVHRHLPLQEKEGPSEVWSYNQLKSTTMIHPWRLAWRTEVSLRNLSVQSFCRLCWQWGNVIMLRSHQQIKLPSDKIMTLNWGRQYRGADKYVVLAMKPLESS